jgi:hypothetical protein
VVHYAPEEVGVAEEAGQVADHSGEHRVVHLVMGDWGFSGFGLERRGRKETRLGPSCSGTKTTETVAPPCPWNYCSTLSVWTMVHD